MNLHLGSGNVRLEGWLNIDLDSENSDLHLDLREKFPFEDESVNFIFSEHLIEHFLREDALSFLKECYRVLKQGGVIRLSTPNLRFLVLTYLSYNTTEWGDLWQPANPCQMMNEGMRFWGHQFLYDADELIEILREAGFEVTQFVGWGQSEHAELHGLETRPFHHELIVESLKSSEIDVYQIMYTKVTEDDSWMNNTRSYNLINQTNNIQAMQLELEWRNQTISSLGQAIANQTNHIQTMQLELEWRNQKISSLGQAIANQTNQIHNIEGVLNSFRSSWFGKIYFAIGKVLRLITLR